MMAKIRLDKLSNDELIKLKSDIQMEIMNRISKLDKEREPEPKVD